MNRIFAHFVSLAAALLFSASATSAGNLDIPSKVTLFKNVKVFNGTEDKLHDVDVLVVKNKIHKVAKDIPESGTWEVEAETRDATRIYPPVSGDFSGYTFRVEAKGDATETIKVEVNVIDGGGRTLMPGLIDGHTHFNHCLPGAGVDGMEVTHWSEIGAMATVCAKEHLMNGFTTVREMGGGTVGAGLKKAIDQGYVEGPRIYPSGAYISQTSGHGDFVAISALSQQDTNLFRLGVAIIADGPDEVRAAVRKQLSLGASQVKIMGGGGVSSLKDPLHSSQYTAEEMKAAVEAAEQYDTYVAAHLYQDVDIRRALEAGILSIEHGQHISDETAKLLIRKGGYHVLNAAGLSPDLFKHPIYGAEGTPPYVKSKQQHELSKNLPQVLANNPEMKVVFQTDLVFTTGDGLRQGIDFEKFRHYELMGPIRALRGMTSTAGELMALSGKMNPYPDGKLGVIEEGAYADILLVDGNPLEDFRAIGGNEKWFDAAPRSQDLKPIRVIMKDGVVYKNTLK